MVSVRCRALRVQYLSWAHNECRTDRMERVYVKLLRPVQQRARVSWVPQDARSARARKSAATDPKCALVTLDLASSTTLRTDPVGRRMTLFELTGESLMLAALLTIAAATGLTLWGLQVVSSAEDQATDTLVRRLMHVLFASFYFVVLVGLSAVLIYLL